MNAKIIGIGLALAGGLQGGEYLVALPEGSDPAWTEVAAALAKSHDGEVVTFSGKAEDLLEPLKSKRPKYLAVVGAPAAFDGKFVRSLNRTGRKVDDDPYLDVRWGLITGATAADAMKLVETREPLVIDRALTTTGIHLGLVESCLTLSDGAKGHYTVKEKGAEPVQKTWDEQAMPGGTAGLFVKAWEETKPQLLVTSSHATQYNLEMPFGLGLLSSMGGKFHVLTKQQLPEFAKFLGGVMFKGDPAKLAAWLAETKPPVLADSPEPKVWVAAGNCLIGDARKSADSMVVTALGSAGVRQFVGYVVPTWFGRAGWGTLELFQASKGQLSLAESFFLNDAKLIDETQKRFPGALAIDFDAEDIESCMRTDRAFNASLGKLQAAGIKVEKDTVGLIHDRDVLAFWGDPAWDARFNGKRAPHALSPTWKKSAAGLELVLEATADFDGGYPVCLPERLAKAPKVDAPEGVEAVAADDFLLIRKMTLKKGETRVIKLGTT